MRLRGKNKVKMMAETIKKEIEKVFNNITIKPSEIILFGSRARGDYKEHSDWDIFIVLDEEIDPQKKREVWYLIYKSLHKKFPLSSFDIILKSKTVYENEKNIVNTLANEVYREGIRL